MKHALLIGWVALTSAACVAQNAQHAETRALVHERIGVNLPQPGHTSQAEREVRDLVKRPLTADAAVQVALLNSPRAQLALQALAHGRARALALRRLPNPKAELSARFGEAGEPPAWDLGATLDLTELLVLGFRAGAADLELEAAKLEATEAVLALAHETRRTFYTHQAAVELHRLHELLLAGTDAALEVARAQHAAGNATDLELAEREAAHEEQRLLVQQARIERDETFERLRSALGLWQRDVKVEVTALESLPAEEPTWVNVEARALERSLNVQLAERRRDAAEERHDADVLRSVLPELGAGVVAEREDGQWALGPLVELEIPLFYQGQAERAASLAEQRGQELQRRQVAIDVRASARTLLSRLQASRSRARHYGERVVPVRERILRQTLLSYNAMTAGVFQLLAAQGAVARTRIAQVTTLRDYWLSRADLEQLLAGRLVRGQSSSAGSELERPAPGQSSDAH